MFQQQNQNKRCILLGLLLLSLATPAVAHEVEIEADVAAVFHLEPNHNPRAGEAANVWFALTRRGGQLIPLSQCNCQLAVYPKSRSTEVAPVLRPQLQAINAEQYQGIPGAEIIFPRSGEYELRFSGMAKPGASFQPFTLRYQVIVRPGSAPATPLPTLTPAALPTSTVARPNPWVIPGVVGAGITGILGIGLATRRRSN